MRYFGSAEEIRAQKVEEAKRHRDARLRGTDKYMLPDYPITDEQREEVRIYRKALRDLPETAGFPEIPMPEKPSFLR